MAHLSPDSPAVDVAVTAVAGPGGSTTEPGLGYGAVSGYREVPVGTYAVSLRAAGADPAGPPVLSTTVDVRPGSARTVAAVGSFADLALAVLDDDLAAPAPGSARVRVIAAAAGAPRVDVDAPGAPLAPDLAFGAAGGYVDVPAGRTTLHIAPDGGPTATVPVTLDAGSVYSLLVLDRDGGGLEVRPVRDAAGVADVVPVGGVPAGGAVPGFLRSLLASLLPAPSSEAPLRVQVPALGVDSPLPPLGVDAAGALVPPGDPAQAGWFAAGPVPGDAGPAVLAGHVDSSRGPGVFFRLAELAPGDEVRVQRADGTTARFTVTRVARYPKTAFPTAEVYGPTPDAELRLITCGGAFDRVRRSYLDNVVVWARLG
ncbi:class F sortase [Geodermatophilus sp. URMC 64]